MQVYKLNGIARPIPEDLSGGAALSRMASAVNLQEIEDLEAKAAM